MCKYGRALLLLLLFFVSINGCNSSDGDSDETVYDLGCIESVQIPEFPIKSFVPLDVEAICDGEELCSFYLNIWKSEFLNRNNMAEEYFNNHIDVDEAYFSTYNDGENFHVEYTVFIGWAAIEYSDNFIVFIASSADAHSDYAGPRDTYLPESEISIVLNTGIFNSSIASIISIEELAYTDANDALQDLRNKADTCSLEFDRLSYWIPGNIPREDGYPYLFGRGVIDQALNQCISGQINLYTMEADFGYRQCVID